MDLQVGPVEQKSNKPLRQKCKKKITIQRFSERCGIPKTMPY